MYFFPYLTVVKLNSDTILVQLSNVSFVKRRELISLLKTFYTKCKLYAGYFSLNIEMTGSGTEKNHKFFLVFEFLAIDSPVRNTDRIHLTERTVPKLKTQFHLLP